MATSEKGACAWRISRLDASEGYAPMFGSPAAAFAVCGGITTFTHAFEIEEGAKVFQKDSCGAACVNIVEDDIEKWVNGSVTLCKNDDRIWEILGLSDALLEDGTGDIQGRGFTMAAGCADVGRKPRVALELWVAQYDCDELADPWPYKRHIFTKTVFAPQGYDVNENLSAPVFSFKAFNNANFGDGPFGDLDILVDNSWVGAYAVVDDDALPDCPDPLDYIATPPTGS